MKKLLLILMLGISLTTVSQTIPSYSNVKLTKLIEGIKSDSIVVYKANKTFGFIKQSQFGVPNLQFVIQNGGVADKDGGMSNVEFLQGSVNNRTFQISNSDGTDSATIFGNKNAISIVNQKDGVGNTSVSVLEGRFAFSQYSSVTGYGTSVFINNAVADTNLYFPSPLIAGNHYLPLTVNNVEADINGNITISSSSSNDTKEYVATIYQNGTSNPDAVVIKNTFTTDPANMVWTRISAGKYKMYIPDLIAGQPWRTVNVSLDSAFDLPTTARVWMQVNGFTIDELFSNGKTVFIYAKNNGTFSDNLLSGGTDLGVTHIRIEYKP